jgi:hypothetical protein
MSVSQTQSAYIEVPGVPGKMKVLGFTCGSTTPVAGQYSTALTQPGIKQLNMLFDPHDKLAAKTLALNKMYSQGTLVLNYAGKPPVKFKLFNMAVKEVPGSGGAKAHPGLTMPKTTGKPPAPVTGSPAGKSFQVNLSVSKIQMEVPQGKKIGPIKKKY